MNRRDFVRLGVSAGFGSVARPATAMKSPSALSLVSYVTPLVVPPVIRPTTHSEPIQICLHAFRHQAHRALPATRMWGYNGMWPGPTIEVRQGQPISIKWINQLPSKHLLPLDYTIHGEGRDVPQVRTVTHVHGARVLPDSDGYPDAWVTADGHMGPVRAADPCHYPNAQAAATLWYHDHALGITRLNVYAGLAGTYLIRDAEEDKLNLPTGAYEIPLMIQDRSFSTDGSLLYPPAVNGTHPAWMQEFFGNAICVNGKAAPFLEVEPRKYRFRLVNGSNSRFYHLKLTPTDAPPFIQIGADGGLLPAPVKMHYLIVSPGERFDIVIDFSKHAGANLALVNDAPAPYARGGEIVPSDVMLFKVTKPLAGVDQSFVPETLAGFFRARRRYRVTGKSFSAHRNGSGFGWVHDDGNAGWGSIGTTPSPKIRRLAQRKSGRSPIPPETFIPCISTWFASRYSTVNRSTRKPTCKPGKLLFTGSAMPPEANERPRLERHCEDILRAT